MKIFGAALFAGALLGLRPNGPHLMVFALLHSVRLCQHFITSRFKESVPHHDA
jgi:hypothetical protein